MKGHSLCQEHAVQNFGSRTKPRDCPPRALCEKEDEMADNVEEIDADEREEVLERAGAINVA